MEERRIRASDLDHPGVGRPVPSWRGETRPAHWPCRWRNRRHPTSIEYVIIGPHHVGPMHSRICGAQLLNQRGRIFWPSTPLDTPAWVLLGFRSFKVQSLKSSSFPRSGPRAGAFL